MDETLKMEGNFVECAADMYVIVNTEQAFVFKTKEIRDFVMNTHLARETTNKSAVDKAITWAKTRGVNKKRAMIKTKCLK